MSQNTHTTRAEKETPLDGQGPLQESEACKQGGARWVTYRPTETRRVLRSRTMHGCLNRSAMRQKNIPRTEVMRLGKASPQVIDQEVRCGPVRVKEATAAKEKLGIATKEMQSTSKQREERYQRETISQYADDTALILKSILEIPYANKAIAKWCRATGMKENMPKRNGPAMGRYRDHPRALTEGRHCKDIKWAKEGKWAICLGVPFGDDLDTAKWWKKKVESVRDKATHWVGLFRASYFGRNLIVQAMYFGSLRYWLYSLVMPHEVVAMVQADADTLW